MKEQFVVTLRGANVWHECVLVCIIDSVNELSLKAVSSYIQTQFDMQINDFRIRFGEWSATTSRKDVTVFIERTTVLDPVKLGKSF